MDPRFAPHNTHLEDSAAFATQDPNLRRINKAPFVHRSVLLDRLPREAGIYTVTGGRQVGKTTLLKQWMAALLADGVPPAAIVYLSGELIDDHHSLVRLVDDILQELTGLRYLLIDEVTYIRGWDKAVKFLADAGRLDAVCLVLTGSDMLIINEARMRFPGRRGRADEVDFHLRPLSFAETVRLKRLLDRDQEASLRDGREPTAAAVSLLFAAFADYLRHGGFLTAINDMAAHGRILPATLRTYSDWIRGDVLKRGRHEHYLREIVTAVIRRYGSQITWNNLVADMTIDHPKTVADYLQLLADMDALFILQAVREDRLCAAPKKARKVFFTDPFIFHALYDWINAGAKNGCELMEQETLADPGRTAQLVEGCAAGHCRRHFPTFYIKAGGEVDIACVAGGRLCPIEVKWTSQLRPAQLKQIKKYPNGAIWTKTRSAGAVEGLRTVPLPLALYRLPAVVTGR